MQLENMKVLNEKEIELIHENSIEILKRSGIEIFSSKVAEMLSQFGCIVENKPKGFLVKFNSDLVLRSLLRCPEEINLYNRDRSNSFKLSQDKINFGSGHNAIFVQDYNTNIRRSATKDDVAQFARLSDYLDKFAITAVEVMPQDVNHPRSSLIHACDAVLNNSKKHLYYSPETDIENEAILNIVSIVADGDLLNKPIATCQVASTSPLCWEAGAVNALVQSAEAGIPICIIAAPYSGVSAPYTLAGLISLHNAEVLSGIVIAQLTREMAPVIYGSAWTNFDMQKAAATIATPEAALLRVAGAQMANFYKLPYHTIGPDSDSNFFDEQLGWEKMLTALMPVLAGASLMINSGMFSTGLTTSKEQLIIDHEIIRIALRIKDGIEINKEKLALENIVNTGPRGNFLADELTFKYLRSDEHILLGVTEHSPYEVLFEKHRSSKHILDNAKKIVQEILKTHKVPPLDKEKNKEIKRVISSFENRLLGTSIKK